MKVSKLKISNFRLLENATINLTEELSVIVGKNNCGKTSILSILKKCIGDAGEKGKFDYFDFSISFQEKLCKYCINEDNNQIIENANDYGITIYMYIEYDENDNLRNLKDIILDLDENNKTVVLKFEYTINKNALEALKENFRKYKVDKDVDKISKNMEKDFLKFITKQHKNYFKFKESTVLYNENNNLPEVSQDVKNINKIINFKYIDAKRDASNTNKKQLSSLANEYYQKIDRKNSNKSYFNELESSLDETDDELTKLYSETIFKQLLDKISKFGGKKQNEITLNIVSNIESENLLNNNTTVVYSDNENLQKSLPEHYNGLGYLNLISIIMKIETLLSDFRKDTEETKEPSDINLLFIEEPEAHTHPQMQYIFIKNIKELLEEGKKFKKGAYESEINLQTLMTTHSSHIVSECDFDDIKYLLRKQNNVEIKNLSELEISYTHKNDKTTKNESSYFKFLKQNLNLGMSEIFFADKAILIEGETERILLPAMMKKIDIEEENKDVLPLLSQNISIITVGNYAQKYANFLNFIGIKTLIITDFDTCKEKEDNGKKISAKPSDADTIYIGNNLKQFFKEYLTNENCNQKEILQNLTLKDKLFSIDEKTESFLKDENGKIFVVYQTEEDGFNGRSFEDAFININKDFIISNMNSFLSLKNKDDFKNKKIDSYNLAEKCIAKKPSFAMDILINSDEKFSNWKIPSYIKEGLEWIQQD